MTGNTFKRYELKYFLTPQQFRSMIKEMKEHMVFDSYCQKGQPYMIYSIYFDTADDTLIRRSLEKPYYKEKLRLRSYKMPSVNSDRIFLELKKKVGGIVTKRRAVMRYDEAMRFVATGEEPVGESYQDRQVIEEISDFLSRYTVTPKVFISYERMAFFGKTDPDLRISFDHSILTRRDHVNLFDGDYGSDLLEDGGYLMEVKCEASMPLWLSNQLSCLRTYSSSFSKYGAEYKRYLQEKKRKAA